jgi:hypothetical protein
LPPPSCTNPRTGQLGTPPAHHLLAEWQVVQPLKDDRRRRRRRRTTASQQAAAACTTTRALSLAPPSIARYMHPLPLAASPPTPLHPCSDLFRKRHRIAIILSFRTSPRFRGAAPRRARSLPAVTQRDTTRRGHSRKEKDGNFTARRGYSRKQSQNKWPAARTVLLCDRRWPAAGPDADPPPAAQAPKQAARVELTPRA